VDDRLYSLTPSQKVFALDAATGKLLWKFDSGVPAKQVNRGLAYWSDGKNDKRILVGIANFLYALDAPTGRVISSFGSGGRIDLREGLGREPVSEQSIALTRYAHATVEPFRKLWAGAD
jgi:quinoprotein glucose dehydrogenase